MLVFLHQNIFLSLVIFAKPIVKIGLMNFLRTTILGRMFFINTRGTLRISLMVPLLRSFSLLLLSLLGP